MLRVGAGERRRDLGGDPRPHPLDLVGTGGLHVRASAASRRGPRPCRTCGRARSGPGRARRRCRPACGSSTRTGCTRWPRRRARPPCTRGSGRPMRPPPMASNAIVAPVATSAAVRSSRNVGELESQTCSAPAERSSAACSGVRTMLTSGMPSAMHSRLSIWPRFEAAAVCTSARVALATHRADQTEDGQRVDEARRALDRGRAVGQVEALADIDAPVLRVHRSAEQGRRCGRGAPGQRPTTRPPPRSRHPRCRRPSDWPRRPARPRRTAGATMAVTTVSSPSPANVAVVMSAPPNSSPRSDGLSGAASTRTST